MLLRSRLWERLDGRGRIDEWEEWLGLDCSARPDRRFVLVTGPRVYVAVIRSMHCTVDPRHPFPLVGLRIKSDVPLLC